MTKPLNIYYLSRIKKPYWYSVVDRHDSGRETRHRTPPHEMGSLRLLRDALIRKGLSADELGGFFYGYVIPHIGKEFDLLRITDSVILSIELKSQGIPLENIKDQLVKNRHYLSHTGKQLKIFTVVTDTLTCYRLTDENELADADFSDVADAVREISDYTDDIDSLFRKGEYLVSPFETPDKFIADEYFFTQAQENVRKELMRGIASRKGCAFFNISGSPGTGKTLLIYDCAKNLSREGRACMIHCGRLSKSQTALGERLENFDIISSSQTEEMLAGENRYGYIFVDEAQRIFTGHFEKIVSFAKKTGRKVIFSSDEGQILTLSEKERNMTKKIAKLGLAGNYCLYERIRANDELQSFIEQIKDLSYKPRKGYDYDIVNLYYAYTYDEAEKMVKSLRKDGYIFINYTKADGEINRFRQYEDFTTSSVIGQEYDKVVMMLDSSFYYDKNGKLCGIPSPDEDYLYPNMFYQGITRARENLAVIVTDAPKLFDRILKIIS